MIQEFFKKRIESGDIVVLRRLVERAACRSGDAGGDQRNPGPPHQPGARDLTVLIDELVQKEKDLRAQQQIYTDEFSKVKELQKSIAELRTQNIPQAGRALLAQLQTREGELNDADHRDVEQRFSASRLARSKSSGCDATRRCTSRCTRTCRVATPMRGWPKRARCRT